MQDRNNTIAGWALFAGIVALGASLVTGEVFKNHPPHEGGLEVAGGEESAGGAAEAEKPIEFYLASADATKGEEPVGRSWRTDRQGCQRLRLL